jgi:hypothetical protein
MTPEYLNCGIGYSIFDREFPHAVDIPIPPKGLGDKLSLLLDATAACGGDAQLWSHSTPANGESAGEIRAFWSRIGTRSPQDARRIARTFRTLGARRVR